MFKRLMIYVFVLFAFCTLSANKVFAEDESNSKTVYVAYTIKAHVSFINGDSEFTIDVLPGDRVSEPSHLQKDGYEFIGWFNDDVLWNFDDPVSNHMSLIAKYRKIDQGTSSDDNSNVISLPKTGIENKSMSSFSPNTTELISFNDSIYSMILILLMLLVTSLVIPDKYLEDIFLW